MRHYSILFILSVVVLSASCNAPKEQDKTPGLKNMAPPSISESVQDGLDVEPNNTTLQAIDVTLTGDAMQWSGELTWDDVDVWKIKAKTGTVADIVLIPESEFDIIADYSFSGNESDRKFYDSDAASQNELIPNIRLTPQGGYLTVKARMDENHAPVRYRVMMTRISVADDALPEGEINDRKETALSLTLPVNVDGTLYPSGDVDYYRLPLRSAANVEFVLPDGAIEVAIENNEKVIWSMLSKSAQTLHSDLLTTDLQDVYIRLTTFEPIKNVLKYQIRVTTPETLPDEIEPNNTVDKAQVIQSDPQSLNLSLLDDADVDIYKLILSPEKIYRVRLSGIQSGEASIQPINSSGALRNDVLFDSQIICDASTQEENALWVKVLPGTAQSWPLNYHLNLDEEAKENVETEPNQTRDQALPFVLDKTIFGHIYPAGDIDYYRIELPSYPKLAGAIGKLNIDIEAGYVSQLALKLTDREGYEISKISNDHLGKPMHLSFDAPNGMYYLEVSGAGDNCLKPYGLKISFEPSEEALLSALANEPAAVPGNPAPAEPSPANPTAAPANPTAAPANPTAAPANPTAAPANPTAAPANPTAAPAPGNAEPSAAQVPDIPLDALIKAAEQGDAQPAAEVPQKHDDDDAF
ncbi:MAG: hypothetical protein J6A01_01080 [Proteobacteria bacterium]|nr:hypothetical protein [Pseudomonadota bacterium]